MQPSAARWSIIGEKATTPVLLHMERSQLRRAPPGEGVPTGHVLPGGVPGVDLLERRYQSAWEHLHVYLDNLDKVERGKSILSDFVIYYQSKMIMIVI